MKKNSVKSINFYEVYTYNPEAMQKKKNRRLIIWPLVIVIVVLACATGYLLFSNSILKSNIKELNAYTENENNIAAEEEVNAIISDRNVAENKYSELKTAHESIKNGTMLTGELLEKTNSNILGAEILDATFDLSAGKIILTMSTSSVENVPDIITKLKTISNYSDVNYYGYYGNDGSYSLVATCVFEK